MPSLHFATSLMGAHLLAEVGPVAGAVGWTYALTLGLALVYLGEHYAVDLIGGRALAEGIRCGRSSRALPSQAVPAAGSGACRGGCGERCGPAMGSAATARAPGRADPPSDGRAPGKPPGPGRRRSRAPTRPGTRRAPGSRQAVPDRRGPGRAAPRRGAAAHRLTRGRLVAGVVFVASMLAFLYFVLPKLLGLQRDVEPHPARQRMVARARRGARGVLVPRLRRAVPRRVRPRRIPDRLAESYQITMASLAATRLFAAAGAGGIALTAWALRRSGMEPRIVACRMIAFLALLYGVYMVTLVIGGVGLYLGVFPGEAPFAITIVPAIFGAVVIVLFLGDLDAARPTSSRLVGPWAAGRRRVARLAFRLAAASATAASGVRTAIDLVRDAQSGAARRRSPGGASTSRCCGRASTPSAARRPRRVIVMSLLRRDARQHAARCRAGSAGSTAA